MMLHSLLRGRAAWSQLLPWPAASDVLRRQREETVAHKLYAVLRDFDDRGAEYIFSEGFSEDNLGRAIMNRLNKAAGYHILKV